MNQNQLKAQCELYKMLLDVDSSRDDEIDNTLAKALSLVVEITGAQTGYMELKNAQDETWWSTYQCSKDEIKAIRKKISSGIITDTIASGETMITTSAILDKRFQHYSSVKSENIKAVLCSPIINENIKGVIYLQGDHFFCKDLQDKSKETELFGRQISPLLRRLKCPISSNSGDLRKEYNLTGVIGENPRYLDNLKQAMLIADLDVTVLLRGETGTGKNLLARTIHNNSSRKYHPFVQINCLNLPEDLLESELFGAVKGAHSSAHVDRKGKISAAEGGTLFLDEIGDLPLSVQAKLLQFLEEGTYYPLGSKVAEKPNVRIIVASHIDFEEALRKKSFRQDLYYRICVFPLSMPSLRECKSDIFAFIEYFTTLYTEKFKTQGLSIPRSTVIGLEEYSWPGNIRELEHRTQQAVLKAMHDSSAVLLPSHFFPALSQNAPLASPCPENLDTTYREGKRSWEKQFILHHLDQNQWNVSETAKILEMSRSQINKLIKEHHIRRSISKDT